jgi:tRNA dimethylallyltransferase
MANPRPPLALIAGPTASGKSSLALALADATGGAIINADSAQIYRDLPILSAAPTAEDRDRAEHRLYGTLDGAKPCSAADWADLAKREIADLHSVGRLPILVGGTGLYIRTLLDGIAPIPSINPAIRAEVRAASVAENVARLTTLDPSAAATLNPGDTNRIARALEVILSTGTRVAEWQRRREGGIADDVALGALILLPPREWLFGRCERRFVSMIEQGALEEVATLLDRDLNPDLPVMHAIGVPELSAVIRGETTLDFAIAAGSQATRRYAKRQYTWFSRQPPAGWPRFTEPLEDGAIDRALALIGAAE